MNPKILIATPTHESKYYCLYEWVRNVSSLDYDNYQVLLVDNSPDDEYKKRVESYGINCLKGPRLDDSSETLCASRKIVWDYALKHKFDYLLMVDQDIFLKPNTINALLDCQKDVIMALNLVGQLADPVTRRKVDWITNATILNKSVMLENGYEGGVWYLLSEIKGQGVVQVRGGGYGCTLISRSVLEKIKPRTIPGLRRYDEHYFFEDCKTLGIPIFLNSNHQVDHYPSLGGGSGWIDITQPTKQKIGHKLI